MRVLIVDDNVDIRDLYAAYLQHQGVEVHTAADGDQAVRRAARLVPDVIVMDLLMPVIDGVAAIHQLKLDARTSRIPIIALTASHQPETRLAAVEARCDGFLTKPCLPEDLLTGLRTVLGP
jgi:CheY-like chemotaxis protein